MAGAILGVVAAVPLFVLLGIVRLLVVALPAALVASPMFLIDAFYQLLLATVLVVIAAMWRHGTTATAWHRALCAGALGAALIMLLGPTYNRALDAAFSLTAPSYDPQGAIGFLPPFQVGLYAALFAAVFAIRDWKRFIAGFAVLVASQIAALVLLQVVARHAGLAPRVSDVRGWALAVPAASCRALTSMNARVAEASGIAALAILATVVVSASVLRAPSGATLWSGNCRTPPRPVHGHGTVRTALTHRCIPPTAHRRAGHCSRACRVRGGI